MPSIMLSASGVQHSWTTWSLPVIPSQHPTMNLNFLKSCAASGVAASESVISESTVRRIMPRQSPRVPASSSGPG
jgi:hypothetical protein